MSDSTIMVLTRVRTIAVLRWLAPLVAFAMILASLLHVAQAGSPYRSSQETQVASTLGSDVGDVAARSHAGNAHVGPNCPTGPGCVPLGMISAVGSDPGAASPSWSWVRHLPRSGLATCLIFHPPKSLHRA